MNGSASTCDIICDIISDVTWYNSVYLVVVDGHGVVHLYFVGEGLQVEGGRAHQHVLDWLPERVLLLRNTQDGLVSLAVLVVMFLTII